jgi:hypothetical protein
LTADCRAPILAAVRAGLVLAIAALAGCVPEGRELRTWTLEIDGESTAVEFPIYGLFELPKHDTTYTLRTTVALGADEAGGTVTVALECFHGDITLTANDVAIADTGDAPVGEHRFVIGPELTARGSLALAFAVHHTSMSAIGIAVSPRLSPGVLPARGPTAAFNRVTGIVELSVLAIFALLYIALYAHDRRRENLLVVLAAIASSIGPLWQLGALELLGSFGSTAIGLGICVTQVSVLAYFHVDFELGPMPRRILYAYAILAVGHLGDSIHLAWALLMNGATMSVGFGIAVVHAVSQAYRITGPRRRDGQIVLAVLLLGTLMIAPDLYGLGVGVSLIGGVHTISLGVILFVIAISLMLARHHVARAKALERVADELRRQVAERSRELADALARLAHAPAAALEADRVIDGRYRVVRKLGAGGMGAVYEVDRDGQRLALKTLRGRVDAEQLSRFAREAQIAAELDHPNLLPVLDVGIADGAMFLVMPLVDGGSIENHRKKFGDAEWARPLVRQIAKGLGALHARGIVHRDLKPANILLAGATPRIADFGLSSLRAQDGLSDTLPSGDSALADTAAQITPLTRAGDLFGTPAYMAPELATGAHDPKPSSDVFAFGLIAYELLTGTTAFVEPPLVARLDGRPPAPRARDGVDPLIARCLDLDPTKRPTAAELAQLP